MKKVSEKQRRRHVRVMKKRTLREDKRKIHRANIIVKMNKLKLAGRRIMKAQRRMMRLAKG